MTSNRSLLFLLLLMVLAGSFLIWWQASSTKLDSSTPPGSSELANATPEQANLASDPVGVALQATAVGERSESTADQKRTGVRGRVLDAKTQKPLAGVEVVVLRELPGFERLTTRFRGLLREGLWKEQEAPVQILGSALSAGDGSFEILGLPPGRVFLDGRSDRVFVRTPGSVRLALGEIAEGVELLGSAGGRITGTLRGPDGLPVSGASITVRPGLNAFLSQITQRKYRWLESKTDPDGKFDLFGVPTGTGYTVSGSSPVIALAESHGVQVIEGQTTTVDLRALQGGFVAGRVVDQQGSPVEGANIALVYLDLSRVLFSADGRDQAIATDSQGEFKIPHVAPGRVAFMAAAENLAPSSIEELAIVDGGVYEGMLLSLGDGRPLSGIVVDDQDRPIADAQVEIMPMERPRDPDVLKMALRFRQVKAKTLPDGRFEARGLTGDRLSIAAMKPGYVSEIRFGVKLEERDIRLQLVRGATVRGKVLDAEGKPLTKFRVETRSRPEDARDDGAVAAATNEASTSRPSRGNRRQRGEFRFDFGGPRGGGDGFDNESSMRMRDGQRLLDMNPESNWQDFLSTDGSFVVTGVPPGKIGVRVRADGYRDPQRQEVVLVAGQQSEELQFKIEPGAIARGTVIDAVTEQPIAGAQVTAHRARNRGGDDDEPRGMPFQMNIDAEDFDFLGMSSLSGRRSALTDSKGQFELDGLNPGKYRFTARHPDLAKASATEVEVAQANATEAIVIRLGAGGGIEGVVTGAGMRPLNDAMVVALSISAGAMKSVTTDPAGRYRLEGLSPGQYVVFKSRFEDTSYNLVYDLLGNMRMKSVTVREGKFAKADIHDETEDGVRVFGVVRDGQQIVPRAVISALSTDKDGPFGIGIRAKPTDLQGNYELIGLKPGTYFFQVNRFMQGPEQVSIAVEIPEGVREYRYDLEIPQSYLAGRVIDNAGLPIEGIQVSAGVLEGATADAGGLLGLILKNGVAQARTDKDGNFKMKSVAPGVYRITATGRMGRRENQKYGESALEGIRVDGKVPIENLELRLPTAGSLEGLVLDGSGVPVANAQVHYERDRREQKSEDTTKALADLFGVQLRPERTGQDGRFKIEGVTPGTYRVRADAEGLAPGVQDDVIVREASASEVRLVVIKGATLRARVTNIDGSRLPLADITVLDSKGKPLASRVSIVSVFRNVMGNEQKKDDSGWHEIGNVPPDTYTVVVREAGKPDLRITREIRDGEVVEWDLDMAAELKRAGR